MAEKNSSNEIKITRIYYAPVKVVWDAWTDPKKAAQWWGPRGFTLTTHSKELKPGGIWHYTMHGPDGTDYPNKAFYHEVEKYSLLVYDHGGYDDRPPLFRVIACFTEVGKDKTKLEMTMRLPTPEAAEEIRKFIKKAGGEATWDRLGEYLAEQEGKHQFLIHRSFDAPIEVLFDMWTKPEHFSKWLPPTGFTMKYGRADIRPGGTSFWAMTNGQMTMYGRAEYKEVSPPDRIVYTQQFVDENEKVSRHPMAPTWPETMKTTVTLTSEGPNRTRVQVCWEPYGKVTPAELEVFLKARGGMTQGWTGSFDKLEAVLDERK